MSTPSEKKPEVFASTKLFDGRVFSVVRQSVRLPHGAEIEREIVEHPGAAAVLPFLDAQHVLLVRQYRPAVESYLVEVPAGVIDSGEAAQTAAERELREETGYRAGQLVPVVSYYPTPGFVQERLSLFLAWDLHAEAAGTSAPDADEHLELVRVPFAELCEQVRRGEVRDGKTVTLVAHICAFPPPELAAWREANRPSR